MIDISTLDQAAIILTLRLAAVSTCVLLIIGTPIAWWLSGTRSRVKPIIEAVVALPLVLPPTVLGFYLLIVFRPDSFLGQSWMSATGTRLSFSFTALVIGSVIYSLPFVVQPLQNAFESGVRSAVQTAATLRASPVDAFISVALPLSLRGFITASVLSFAHTLGEFGVVLMVGGNIPEKTRVASIAVYEHVETLDYASAHSLSLILLVLSFVILVCVYGFNRKAVLHV